MTTLELLKEIDRLTKAQNGLISIGDNANLIKNLEFKEAYLRELKTRPLSDIDTECRAIIESINSAANENIQSTQDEMTRLRNTMKKTHEGKATVRGYEGLGNPAGATYIDRKK